MAFKSKKDKYRYWDSWDSDNYTVRMKERNKKNLSKKRSKEDKERWLYKQKKKTKNHFAFWEHH